MPRQATRTPVEDCLRLDLASPAVARQVRLNSFTWGTWKWSSDGEPRGQVSFSINPDAARLVLEYRINGQPVRQEIGLTQTTPNYGGVRWWFFCPTAQERGELRRVRCLFLPPGGRIFSSRLAYGLNYASQRQSNMTKVIDRLLRSCY